MRKAIIDTDPGHDDLIAIMLAERSKKFGIKALTTVAGNSNIKNTTRNARYTLKLLGREDIPVYSGAKKPLKRKLVKGGAVHGESGLAGVEVDTPVKLTNNAVKKILSIVKRNPNEITIITLGPLTNIAKAIKKDPKTMSEVQEIVMMGGSIRLPGNVTRASEFNIYVDPKAAQTVFQFPVDKTLVPIERCREIPLPKEYFKDLKDKKFYKPMIGMLEHFQNNLQNFLGIKKITLPDAVTVYYLIKPDACETKTYDIVVETEGKITRGMTIPDLRNVEDKSKNIKVVTNISNKKFKKDFLRILKN